MNKITFQNAYYIKLGRGGRWEKSAIQGHKLRIGWHDLTLAEINSEEWKKLWPRIRKSSKDDGAATRDLEALKRIYQSTPDDIWITFYDGCLWWGRVGKKGIREDRMSRYRLLSEGWSNGDIHGKALSIVDLPGGLTKTQAFRGTACEVKHPDILSRVLNCETSIQYKNLEATKRELIQRVSEAISLLHWKDFETLVDLVFRASGWQRISMLGQTQKGSDLDLQDVITKKRYQVQVKISANRADLEESLESFNDELYERFYFVVQEAKSSLRVCASDYQKNVEIIFTEPLSEMVVDAGLVKWILNKIR